MIFLTINKLEVLHNFLKHYSDGETKPFEGSPIKIKKSGNITTY